MKEIEVLIIGGGLAGLTAAIHLSKKGFQVIVIEKNEFPKHKVCGEYISNEVVPYLNWLGINSNDLHSTLITKLQFSIPNGKTVDCVLPLGGFGISRYALDEYLYRKTVSYGCTILKDSVESVVFNENQFTVTTLNNVILKAKIVLGAFGKRSNVDQKLNRSFIQKNHLGWL